MFKLKWENLNNVSSGCFGLCTEISEVRLEIGRKFPQGPGWAEIDSQTFTNTTEPYQEKTIFVTKLCNANLDQPIRFSAWVGLTMINEVTITINQMQDKRIWEG